MRHFTKVFLVLVLFLLGIAYSTDILAACEDNSDCKLGRTCREGVCVSNAKSGCTKDSDCKGNRICENEKCVNLGNVTTDSQQQQSISAPFCCDSFGNRRCIITINPGPNGSACFCTGQGWGYICR
jgi:hypothetical protein